MASIDRLAVVAALGFMMAGGAGLGHAVAQVASPPPAEGAAAQPPLPATPAMLVAQRVATAAARGDHSDDIAAIKTFYEANSGGLLWVDGGKFNARARSVLEEIGKADDWGLTASSFQLPAAPAAGDMDGALRAETQLSLAVLKYARHARGGRFDPSRITESLDRSPNLLAGDAVLAGIAGSSSPDAYLRKLHPQHAQFEKLRQLYLAARAGTLEVPAAPVTQAEAEPPRKGRRKKAAAAPAAPPAITPERVLVNMEQWRWMPDDLGALYVQVNIPEYQLHVIKNGAEIFTERVVTGTATNQTPIFSKEMQTVVFQPGWGVPSGIKVKELLPGLLAGRDSISGKGLVVRHRGREVSPMSIDWRTTDIRKISIVQPPGPRNALGQVKFLFPNKHDVYMHDTPSKSLFNASSRAFSHGCVRVRNPLRFAELIFAETGGWAPQRVASLTRGKPENEVPVPGRIHVHLTYFTVVVGDDGKPQVFRDVYGHESRIKAGIEGRAEAVAKKPDDLNAIRKGLVARTRGVETARMERAGGPSAKGPRRGAANGGGGGGLFGWF